MNIELLISFKKHTDIMIEHTGSHPQQTLEFKLNKQMEFFPFHHQ